MATKATLPPGTKLVCLILGVYFAKGQTEIHSKTLRARTGFEKAAIAKHLKVAEEAGYLIIKGNYDPKTGHREVRTYLPRLPDAPANGVVVPFPGMQQATEVANSCDPASPPGQEDEKPGQGSEIEPMPKFENRTTRMDGQRAAVLYGSSRTPLADLATTTIDVAPDNTADPPTPPVLQPSHPTFGCWGTLQ